MGGRGFWPPTWNGIGVAQSTRHRIRIKVISYSWNELAEGNIIVRRIGWSNWPVGGVVCRQISSWRVRVKPSYRVDCSRIDRIGRNRAVRRRIGYDNSPSGSGCCPSSKYQVFGAVRFCLSVQHDPIAMFTPLVGNFRAIGQCGVPFLECA